MRLTRHQCRALLAFSLVVFWCHTGQAWQPNPVVVVGKRFYPPQKFQHIRRSSVFQMHAQRQQQRDDRVQSQSPGSKDTRQQSGFCWKTALAQSLVSALLVFQMAFSAISPALAADTAPTNMPIRQKYWTIMEEGTPEAKVQANRALMDYAVMQVNTMFYDNTAGFSFNTQEYHLKFVGWFTKFGKEQLATREGAVDGMKWLTQELHDPFSKYLTRQELIQELRSSNDGFLGLGAVVEPASENAFFGALRTPVLSQIPPTIRTSSASKSGSASSSSSSSSLLSANQVASVPVLTAIAPNSPAERAGLTVGDRVVAVQRDSFLGLSPGAAKSRLQAKYHAENYMGTVELTIAKPVYATALPFVEEEEARSVIVAYRPQRIKLTTTASALSSPESTGILQYQLLTSGSTSPFRSMENDKVGYIRLTRFSKAGTSAFLQAVQELEKQGASAYIIDLRNNYGGVIQEALLTASSLLRDPHSVLCYTLNSRGGFRPIAVEEYVVDQRYPGYLLSKESKFAALQQLKKDSPEYFSGDGWSPPSSYASLREQSLKRQYKTRPSLQYVGQDNAVLRHQKASQKPMVILVNEGTASSAEVFASALHDNGRLAALVGTRTYGKGLIQHTFPMPDGGGLRLTVGEYLTPSLKHMTHVGGAQFDRRTGQWTGGGIQPDVVCENIQGIPSNAGGDLCVGVGLDVLAEARVQTKQKRIDTSPFLAQKNTFWSSP